MVEQQIRTWEVLDQRVLDLLFRVRREEFVPAPYRALAFVDMEIPLGHGEKMLQPKLEARMVQELALEPDRPRARSRHRQRLHDRAARQSAARTSTASTSSTSSPAARREKLAAHGITQRDARDRRRRARLGQARALRRDRAHRLGAGPVARASGRASKPGGRLLAVVGEPPVMEAQLVTCAAQRRLQHGRPVRDLHRAAEERAAARAVRVLKLATRLCPWASTAKSPLE